MKLASFFVEGAPTYGIVTERGAIDAGARLRARYPSLRAALTPAALPELRALAEKLAPDVALSDIAFDLPAPDAAKIICVGLNYRGHIEESGVAAPKYPPLFLRFADSLAPHGSPLVRPKVSTQLDYEAELAVVIGKPGRHILKEQALSHVAGYSCFNEGSIRDYQFNHFLSVGKNFHASGAFGPWIVTADEIPDPETLSISTVLNGAVVQDDNTRDHLFGVAELIAYVSVFTSLGPGDVITTGTPKGVGLARVPPLWLKPGDEVEVRISGVGVLRNTVVDEA